MAPLHLTTLPHRHWCVFAGVGFLTPAEHLGRGEVLHRAELGAEPGLELLRPRPRPALHVDRLPPRGRGGRPIRAVTMMVWRRWRWQISGGRPTRGWRGRGLRGSPAASSSARGRGRGVAADGPHGGRGRPAQLPVLNARVVPRYLLLHRKRGPALRPGPDGGGGPTLAETLR